MDATTLYEEGLHEESRPVRPDQRAELLLGALACAVVAFVLAMLFFVAREGWPSFRHNGFGWFASGDPVDQQFEAIFKAGAFEGKTLLDFNAWPLIWSTFLITGGAVILAFGSSLFVAVFIVEFAPEWMRRILVPVVRLLASVPSVIYGLLGVLVLVPFIGNNLITEHQRESVAFVVSLNGASLLAAILILTIMIAPIMIAIFSDGLRAVPRGWLEGSLGLGINRWRTFWKIAVRTARPALVAGTVLAMARALGEVVMLLMVSGGVGFAPNFADGFIVVFEPSTPVAATILKYGEQLGTPGMRPTLFALATLLLFSAATLSLTGWAAKQPLKKYGVRA